MGIWDRLSRTLDQLSEELLPDELRDQVAGARALVERGQPGVAAAALDAVLRQKPDHATALYLLGVARLRLGDARSAAAAFARAIDARAGFREASLGLGQARLELGELPGAIAAFRDALAQAAGDRETLAAAYRGLGRAHLAAGDRDKGLRELRKALVEDPDDAEAAVALAGALLAGETPGAAEEARAPLERVAKDADAPPVVLAALGRLDLRTGRLEAAEQALRRALAAPAPALPPAARAEALAALAEALLRRGDARAAHERLLEAIELEPRRADLHARLAEVHRAVDNVDAALASWEHAATLGEASALEPALEVALAAGRVEQAAALAARLLEASPEHPRALAARGAALLLAGERDAARAALDRALAAGEAHEARLALARLELDAGEPERAAEAIRAVLRARPGDARARALLAEAQRRGLAADRPADDVHALAARVHAATLARRELADLAVPAAETLESFDRPLLVTVMGEFSSGKSTFVNALLGAEVAPVGITPTTATINILKYGRERKGRLVTMDDREREVAWDELPALLRGVDAEVARGIRFVEVLYPLEALERVNIVDTPGLNSILPEHEATARRFLAHADAIVWLFTVGQAGKATERAALERIRAEGKRVLGVVNKIDQATPAEVERIVGHLRDELGELVDALVPVSARRALAARAARDAEALLASRWPELDAALEERFFLQARALKRAACATRLRGLLATARERVVAAAAAATERRADLGRAAAAARADAEIFRRAVVPEERRALAERLAATYRQAAREVLELVRPRRTPFGSNTATPADRDYLLGLLERGLEAVLEPTRRRVADELRRAGADAAAAARAAADVVGAAAAEELERRVADAVTLFDAGVFDRCRAFLRGYLRGGRLDEFFVRTLAKLELEEDAVYHALVRDAPDLDVELLAPLVAHGEAALRGLAERLDLLAGVADVARHELEEGVLAALDAHVAELGRLAG